MFIKFLLNRKIFFYSSLLAFLALPANRTLAAQETVRAVSLRALQTELKLCQDQKSCSEELLKFANLNLIIGYVIDEKNNDIIIIGKIDPKLPPLYLEDFVIALRSAWGIYHPYDNPLCAIDPDPRVFTQLQSLGQRILSSASSEQVEKVIEEWHRICQKPHNVRILGIPFDSRFARIMVQADYEMKKIANGSDSIGVTGFKSLADMTIDRIRNDVIQNRPISVSLSSMKRFWFYPGATLYDDDEGIVLSKQYRVNLLTEEQYLPSTEKFMNTAAPSSLAQEFAKNFTELYDEIAAERPIYNELKNLFIFITLAKIIKYKSADTKAGIDLKYLLKEYPIAPTNVERKLPGLGTVKKFQYEKDLQGGYQVALFWLPTCGGVSIEIKMSPKFFTHRENQVFKAAILNSRPSSSSPYWDYINDSDSTIVKHSESGLHSLTIKTDPQSAQVILKSLETDSLYEGTTPFSIKVSPSNYVFFISKSGYKIHLAKIDLLNTKQKTLFL